MKRFTDGLKKKWNELEGKYLFFAFLVPLIIMWLIYITMEVYPFGENSVLVLDLNGQYVYFFEELRSKVLEGGSLLYSFGRTLGGEFLGIYAYYLSSPFSYLVCLFPKEHITEALLCIFLLKVGSMGLTMGLYLHHTTRHVNKTSIVMFSTMYALSAYAVVQAHNTMWIDNLIALPLIALGIERLIQKKDFRLFVGAFIYSLMTSFYIGYMTCFFVAAYFFYYYFGHTEASENNLYGESRHFLKSLGRIIGYSAIAIACSAVILLPAYYSLKFGKTTFSDPVFAFEQRFDFLDLFVKLLPGSYDTVRPEGLPFLYCGTLTLLLLPIYFITKQIRSQEKVAAGVLISFFLVSFNISAIDMVWHGFQKPNWLNYRYSFMLIFIFLVLAYRAFQHFDKLDFRFLVVATACLGVITILIQKQDYSFVNDFSCIWFTLIALAVYTIILHSVNSPSLPRLREAAVSILCIMVCLEMFLAGLLNTIALDNDVVISSRTSYVGYMNKVQPVVDFVQEQDDSIFYRMEKTLHRKTNDPMALGYYGISNSTSTLNASVIRFLHLLGFSSKSNWTKYYGGTAFSDSLLGIKYVLTDTDTDLRLYDMIYENIDNGYRAWKNPYALSLAFGVNDKLLDLDIEENESPFLLMNQIAARSLGLQSVHVFDTVDITDVTYDNVASGYVTEHRKYSKDNSLQTARINYVLNVTGGQEVFLCFPTDYPREATLKINGREEGTVLGNETDRIISLGYYEKDATVTVSIVLKDDPLYIMTGYSFFYGLNEEKFIEVIDKMNRSPLEITKFSDTSIEGTVSIADDATTLLTTLPYDEGWQIRVDGKKVEPIMALNSLLAVPMTPGQHTVTFHYLPSCVVAGVLITAAGFILLILALVFYGWNRRRVRKAWADGNEALLYAPVPQDAASPAWEDDAETIPTDLDDPE